MENSTTARRGCAALLLALLVAGAAVAQQSPPGEPAEAQPSPPVPEERESPRATMFTFLGAFDTESARVDYPTAIATLQLDPGLSDSARQLHGREVATRLKDVLDRIRRIEPEELPIEVAGERHVWETVEDVEIAFVRTAQEGWLFSRETLAALPLLEAALADRAIAEGVAEAPRTLAMWVRARVPETLRERDFLLERWQWLALPLLLLLSLLADRLARWVLRAAFGGLLLRWVEPGPEDREIVRDGLRPFGLLALAAVWWLGLQALDLPLGLLRILVFSTRLVALVGAVWAGLRLVHLAFLRLSARAAASQTGYDDLLFPMLERSLKILIAVFGLLFLAQNVGLEIGGLLAGVGLGGIAIALAAQDVVRNLFGSITVLVDQPFAVGDWITVNGIEGTVDEMGFRSTRIRTFYDSMVSLPNSNLISAAVDNYGRRRYRRWKTTLGVAYDTPRDSIERLCEGLRRIIDEHPAVRSDAFHVYLTGFGAHSLDVLIYLFFDVASYQEELQAKHELCLAFLALAEELEVEIAFPTQTLHLHLAEAQQERGRAEHRGTDDVEEPAS